MSLTRFAGFVIAISLVLGVAPSGEQTSTVLDPEQLARRQYETGLEYRKQKKDDQALYDFKQVVSSYPTSAVADDALLEVIRYHLEVSGDLAAAETATVQLMTTYSGSNAAPMGYVMSGRIILAQSRAPLDLDKAFAQFDRVRQYYRESDTVPVAEYYAGETLRLSRRNEEAISRYRDLALAFPSSEWTARGRLGAARAYVALDRPIEALEELQRIRTRFPETPEAAQALSWNTALYRLHIKPSASQPAYAYQNRNLAGAGGKLRDVTAIAIDERQNVFVASRNAVISFGPDGNARQMPALLNPRELFFDRSGRLTVLMRAALQPEQGKPVPLTAPKPDGTERQLEDVSGAATWSTGEYLIADSSSRGVVKFSAAGKWIGAFVPLVPNRMVVNYLDEIAALDNEGKTIHVFDRDGKTIRRIGFKGTGYELNKPNDLAFDALGNLYVLDRGRSSVVVFSPSAKHLVTFTIPEKAPGAFREANAFGLDAAARLFIHDGRAERIQIYE